MSIENCNCRYYDMVDGKLLCVACGAPSKRFKVEDKAQAKSENKGGVNYPAQSRRRKG